jgi:hypothetical protein
MVNCALMGADWRELTWWQYTAMLTVWNDRHDMGDGKKPPPDLSDLSRRLAFATAQ